MRISANSIDYCISEGVISFHKSSVSLFLLMHYRFGYINGKRTSRFVKYISSSGKWRDVVACPYRACSLEASRHIISTKPLNSRNCEFVSQVRPFPYTSGAVEPKFSATSCPDRDRHVTLSHTSLFLTAAIVLSVFLFFQE